MTSDSGLSDALRNLADAQVQPPSPAPDELQDARPVVDTHDLEAAIPSAAPRIHAASVQRPAARPAGGALKVVAVPVLAVVGLLLMVPGVWAVLLLTGMPVLGDDRTDARHMAAAMLFAWPIAAVLLAASGVCFVQLRAARRR